jgi:peptidoglycan hydrolase-like protein with peptidoglycan-binding domain
MSNGILNSFFTTLQNNPSAAAGSCTFVVAFALVAGNAFYAQSGVHPDPIWATRDLTTTQSVSQNVRPVKTTKYSPKVIPTPLTGDDARSRANNNSRNIELVSSIQAALAEKGYFAGDVDGLMGPLTGNSIKKYQTKIGLKATGIPSQELLLLIKQETASASSSDALTEIIADNSGANIGYDKNLVKQIQSGIINAGIANIDADGIYGKQTEAAIMVFQKDNGLDVTGKPDANTLNKLQKLKLIEADQSNI